MNISQIAKNLGVAISKNSPTILTFLAVGGVITTTVLAVKATPKAIQLLEEEKERRRLDSNEERIYYEPGKSITKLEIIRLTWRCFLPASAVGAATIFCIIGANAINLRRNAAISAVLAISEKAFKEFQSKTIEQIGEAKTQKIRDDIATDHVKANPPGPNEVIFTGNGDVLCYDSLSGRYFKSDIEKIKQGINNLNHQLLSEMFISVNELYDILGISHTKLGYEMGWDIDKGLIEISYSSTLSDKNEPCLVLNYDIDPRFRGNY